MGDFSGTVMSKMGEPSIGELVSLFAAGLLVGLLLTPFVRAAARRVGLVDRPDGRRKIHKSPVPVAGGVAIYVATCVVLAIAYFAMPTWRQPATQQWPTFFSLFLAASVLAIVGVIDDYCGMRSLYKFLAQLLATGIVVYGGLVVRSFTILGNEVDLGVLAVPLTMFWLLGAINSLNFIDGIDGLLGSIGLILCLTIGGMAFLNGNFAAACIAVTLGGSLLAFLMFNFPPASIFLGDAGSMLIGLVVGALAIHASLKGPATVALAAPVALMIIPIFDTSAAIIRRKLTGRSLSTTDRGHLHHVLMKGGFSNRNVVLAVSGMCALVAVGVLITVWLKNEVYAVGTALALVVFLLVSRMFGYVEFLLVKERLLGVVANLRHGSDFGRVRQTKVHLQGSANWNELWRELTHSAEELKLKTLTLDVNAPAIHEGYHARWERVHKDRSEVPSVWRIEIPLTVAHQSVGRLDVECFRDEESAWQKLAALAKIVEDIELVIAEIAVSRSKVDALATSSPEAASKGLQLERV